MDAELTNPPQRSGALGAGNPAMAAAEAVRSARRRDHRAEPSAAARTEALLYLRVSTKRQANMGGQEEGFSLPAQREAATRKAESIGVTVAGEYVDRGESARSAKRPALQQMLADIATGRYPQVRYLIVHKIDRLARNRGDDIAINAALEAAGIELISCSEFFDNSPGGLLQYGIQAEMAQYYSRNLAQEVLKGSTQKAKVGGTPYRAPVGYLNERSFDDGREHRFISIDPARAPLVTWCFEQYATGEWTAANLLAEATERGLRSRPSPKRLAKAITVTGFLYLLKNPYYMGLVRYRGALYPGQHPALVTPELWLQVQDILASHDKSGEKTREHAHYLKGTIYCASCGSRLVFSRSKGNGGTYDYFFCLARQQHTAGRKRPTTSDRQAEARCNQPYIRTDLIEAAIEDYYQTFRLSEQRADAIRTAVATELEHETTDAADEVTRQEQTLTRLERERQKLLQAHYADAIPLDLMKTEMARLTRETSTAERRLKAAHIKWGDVQGILDKALTLAGTCHQHYQHAPDPIRRQLNQGFFHKIYIGRDGQVARVELTDAFSLLLADDLLDRIEAERTEAPTYERAALTDPWASPGFLNDKGPDPFGSDPFAVDVADVHGSNVRTMVELRGIEPLTSSMPWAAFYRGDENSNEQVQRALSEIDGLIARTGIAVAITHHPAKSTGSQNASPEDTWRGASRFADWATTRITIAEHHKPSDAKRLGLSRLDARRHVKVSVLTRGEPIEDFSMEADPVTRRWTASPTTARPTRSKISPQEAATACREAGGFPPPKLPPKPSEWPRGPHRWHSKAPSGKDS